MNSVSVGKDGFYHPANEHDLGQLIQIANRRGYKIRVRGAAHSVDAAIYTDNFGKNGAPRSLDIILDKLIGLTFDDAKMQVTVQAGCHLGVDPSDPTKSSTLQNSLFYQLDERGWAIPTMGGIIHQTVGGFLSTGSAGGSLQHSMGDHIVAIRLVDGKGQVHELSEKKDPDRFYAAGVSMGLLGIITAVTFQCVEKFHVMGQEVTTKLAECKIDLFGFGDGYSRAGLQTFLENTEHARLLWWPQAGVEKMTVWQGRAMESADYNTETGSKKNFKPNPYKQFPELFGSGTPAQVFTGLFYRFAKTWNSSGFRGGFTRQVLKLILAPMINLFASTVGNEGRQTFWDDWMKILPMDNQLSDKWIPFGFMEMWFPLSKTTAVMKKLREHFQKHGLSATGVYPCEIYAKKRSKFWMSPAYGRDVVKINFFWFKKNKDNPAETYFPQFWTLLKEFDFRLHWGKYLPEDPNIGVRYLKSRYPQWDNFMRIREEMDPNQIFVTNYWRKHLAIESRKEKGETIHEEMQIASKAAL